MVCRVHVAFTVSGRWIPLGMPAPEGCLKDETCFYKLLVLVICKDVAALF